jgi:hypothetical protein
MSQWKPLGLIASGRMRDSLLLRRPALCRFLGPVAAADARLASRYANTLRAGQPARPAELRSCGLILVQAGPADLGRVLPLLRAAAPSRDSCLALLSAELDSSALEEFRAAGARVCSVAAAPAAARDLVVLEGDAAAIRRARPWLEEAHLRCLELKPRTKPLFLLGLQAVSGLLPPLLDAAMRSLRAAGLPAAEARRMLRFLAESAVRSFVAHGRKGWENPAAPARLPVLERQLEAAMAQSPPLVAFQQALLRAVAEFYGQPSAEPPQAGEESRVVRFPASITKV